MAFVVKPRRAAQYLRMSTEHQQYSTANQSDAITVYAAARDIKIVASYEDAGKSGLTLAGRPSLRKLIAEVVAGQDKFDLILVYDVSRWGRFQDADESAHLEYLCRIAGVHVEYCAEPFSNDGTPFANICKVVKRALAAEYSRELSEKVYAGKRRLIILGFRQGGSAGYGLRRCLVDDKGKRKGLIKRGKRKSIATDRIILVPGPPEEVAVVKRIFRDYTQRGLGMQVIANRLNEKGIRSESGRPWTKAVVKTVLASEKYIGNSVWGRFSNKLRTKSLRNSPTDWIRFDGAFTGIVSRELFEKAQSIRSDRTSHLSDEEILSILRGLHRKHGKLTAEIIDECRTIKHCAVRERFGGLVRAYEMIGYRPSRDFEFLARNAAATRLRASIAERFEQGANACGASIEHLGSSRFLVNGEFSVSLAVVKQRQSQRGNPRWKVKTGGSTDDLTIAALMDGTQERVRSYFFFTSSELGTGQFLAVRNPVYVEVFRSDNLDAIFPLFKRQPIERADTASQTTIPYRKFKIPRSPSDDGRERVDLRRFRAVQSKSYTASFARASSYLGAAIERADAVTHHVDVLRQALVALANNQRFSALLTSNDFTTLPVHIFRHDGIFRQQKEMFFSSLRANALALLGGNELNRRARQVLMRLEQSRRVEAAEFMVLLSDYTEHFALALVTATPPEQLVPRKKKRVYGAETEQLAALVEEAEHVFCETKRALCLFRLNSLDLAVLSALARRLLANTRVLKWLERYEPLVLGDLRRTCDKRLA